jgi:hypothetical protein
MSMTRKNMTKTIMIMALILGASRLIPAGLHAQGLQSLPDTSFAGKPLTGSLNTAIGLHTTNGAFGGGHADNFNFSQLHLTKSLSLQTGVPSNYASFSTRMQNMQSYGVTDGTTGPNTAGFRRGDLGLRGVRLDIQHFTLGASYNGLNNIMKPGGFSGDNSRNAGLSIHAGLTF